MKKIKNTILVLAFIALAVANVNVLNHSNDDNSSSLSLKNLISIACADYFSGEGDETEVWGLQQDGTCTCSDGRTGKQATCTEGSTGSSCDKDGSDDFCYIKGEGEC